METDTRKPARFNNAVVAALETSANRRRPQGSAKPNGGKAAERTAAIVDDAFAKIKAGDFDAIEELCTHQALALDAIFDQCARRACDDDRIFRSPMVLALRAQSHCRATINTLMALRNRGGAKISRKRTIETANSHA
jgi:hypothetical protein